MDGHVQRVVLDFEMEAEEGDRSLTGFGSYR